MAEQPVSKQEKATLPRFEWKVIEAQYAEIPFSQLRSFDGEDAWTKFSNNTADTRIENEPPSFFDVFKLIDPRKTSLADIIIKIAADSGLLTQQRLETLILYLRGKSKRDITKILHPDRDDMDVKKTTIGIEVYTQRNINHFIPATLRRYIERKYPYIVWKKLGIYPIHPDFIKKAFRDSIIDPENPLDFFFEMYSGNPHCLFELKTLIASIKNKRTPFVRDVLIYLLQKWKKKDFKLDEIENIFKSGDVILWPVLKYFRACLQKMQMKNS